MKDKELTKIEDLKFDDKNFNRHTQYGHKLLEDSLRKFGAGRSILIDKNGKIVAGNGIAETAADIGLDDIIERHRCGRVAVFRNHSKIMSGQGEKFAFTIESSANINTNPRTEQTQVTVNDELYHFYKDYFDGIISIDKKADAK